MVTSGHRPYRPFSDETLKVMKVEKVLENSATRLFYLAAPGSNPAHVTHHIKAPGKENSCIAEITLRRNTSEDDARKIALSLTKAQ